AHLIPPLLPYTTLFRSSFASQILAALDPMSECVRLLLPAPKPQHQRRNAHSAGVHSRLLWLHLSRLKSSCLLRPGSLSALRNSRSEEHTSELQSPDHLV